MIQWQLLPQFVANFTSYGNKKDRHGMAVLWG